jgi:DNA-binding GntR family transcriptional regulator
MAEPAAVPLYEQVRSVLRERIAAGTYAPGDRLPSESALAAEFEVHRLTVRRALEELAREGIVVARKGSGTYVAPRHVPLPIFIPLRPQAFAPSLDRQLAAAGREFREVLLGVGRNDRGASVPAPLRDTGPLYLVRSALEVDGQFWVYTTAWVAQRRVKGIARDWRESDGLYGVLLDQVGELVSLWRSFLAEPAGPEVAEVLDLRPGAPVLVREGLTTDVDRAPVLFVRRHARADRVSYVINYEDPDLPA